MDSIDITQPSLAPFNEDATGSYDNTFDDKIRPRRSMSKELEKLLTPGRDGTYYDDESRVDPDADIMTLT